MSVAQCRMAPTAFVPYSQYATFDHDENQEHWAIEMLDNDFWMNNRGSSSDLPDRDRRLQAAVDSLDWPFTRQVKVCVPAGSIVLMPQNLFHRRTRRLDEEARRADHPRIMWRFWLYRTTEPVSQTESRSAELDWCGLQDTISRANLSLTTTDQKVVWDTVIAWMRGEAPPSGAVYRVQNRSPQEEQDELRALSARLRSRGEGMEVVRVGAAYVLGLAGRARSQNTQEMVISLLTTALQDDRECVRRAASYGLIVLGPLCVDRLAKLVLPGTAAKWVRKNAMFCLGEVAPPTERVVHALRAILDTEGREHNSVHLRATAAMALGNILRRALARDRLSATRAHRSAIRAAIKALLTCVATEPNRVPNSTRQNRSVYQGYPDDISDICEGGSLVPPPYYDAPREAGPFAAVRSAVKENALWSLVQVCTNVHLDTADGLAIFLAADKQSDGGVSRLLPEMMSVLSRVATSDDCIHCSGFAMDALNRLANSNPPGEERRGVGADARIGSVLPTETLAVSSLADFQAERERLLSSETLMPCVNWETISRSVPVDVPRQSYLSSLTFMATQADTRHQRAAEAAQR
eukprot:COSAG03_NODE_166_length_11291_cov_15.762866_2_plen_579_part_00